MDATLLAIINETQQLRADLHDQVEALPEPCLELAITLQSIEDRLGTALARLTDIAYSQEVNISGAAGNTQL